MAQVAILSAAATAANQNAWIGFMKTELAKHPELKLVDTVYGNDDTHLVHPEGRRTHAGSP